MKREQYNIVNFACGYLVFYSLWGWIFTHSIYSNSIYVYSSFLLLAIIFTFLNINAINYSHRITSSNIGTTWIPYFILAGATYLLIGQIEQFAYRYITILLLIAASRIRFIDKYPYKLILYGGLLALGGIILQLFFPSIYYSSIFPLFSYDEIEIFEDIEIGYNGITYQTGQTAPILLYAEYVAIYKNQEINLLRNNKWIRIIIISLLIVGVFLTGKRIYSLISILVPAIVYNISKKNKFTQSLTLIFTIIAFIVFAQYIEANSESLSDSKLVGRLASSFSNADNETALMSGRDQLWEIAINLFKSSPIFGVGVEAFNQITETSVHNIYLQCLCEYGIFGFLLFIVPLIYCIITTIKMGKTEGNKDLKHTILFSLACQLHFIISGLTANPMTNLTGYIMYILAVVLVINSSHRAKFNPHNNK